MRVVAPLCAVVALFAAACAPKGETSVKDSAATAAPPVVDAAAVRQAIEQANNKYVDAVIRGDSAGLIANYADDMVDMDAGRPGWGGRADLALGLGKWIKSQKISDYKYNIQSVNVAGDYAIETGSYEFTGTPKGGKPMPNKGKYLTVWKKQGDGSWKIIRDISSSAPPPPKT